MTTSIQMKNEFRNTDRVIIVGYKGFVGSYMTKVIDGRCKDLRLIDLDEFRDKRRLSKLMRGRSDGRTFIIFLATRVHQHKWIGETCVLSDECDVRTTIDDYVSTYLPIVKNMRSQELRVFFFSSNAVNGVRETAYAKCKKTLEHVFITELENSENVTSLTIVRPPTLFGSPLIRRLYAWKVLYGNSTRYFDFLGFFVGEFLSFCENIEAGETIVRVFDKESVQPRITILLPPEETRMSLTSLLLSSSVLYDALKEKIRNSDDTVQFGSTYNPLNIPIARLSSENKMSHVRMNNYGKERT